MKKISGTLLVILLSLGAQTARAEFIPSSAIVEFTNDGPRQQDIELISRSKNSDYIVCEVSEIRNPGQPDESRVLLDDPSQGMLLVTPDKTILAGGSQKVLRFVLLKDLDEQEHIYRVAVKPVIKGVENDSKLGLKVLVGYEVLVIVRPASMATAYTAHRNGKEFSVTNSGNTDILFQNGKQCADEESKDCPRAPVLRVYPGTTKAVELPSAAAVKYSIWDGQKSEEKSY